MALNWRRCPFPNGFTELKRDDIAGLTDRFPELVNWLVSCFVNEQHGDGVSHSEPVQGLEEGAPIREGGGGDVTLKGNDSLGSSETGNSFAFASETDSNIRIRVADEDGEKKIYIGAYWL